MDWLVTFLQVVFSGLAAGSVYALIALAMVIIYRTTEVLNFAQGDMAMLCANVGLAFLVTGALPFPLAVAAALAFAALLGACAEFFFLRRAKEPTVLSLIIITLGLEMIVFGFASWKWGGEPRDFPIPLSPADVLVVGGVIMGHLELATIGIAGLIIAALFFFLARSKAGLAMRSTQQNRAAARLMGIRVRRVEMGAWSLAAMIGCIAGLLVGPAATVEPYMMWDPMMKGFAAAVLGGITSLPGAALGGAIIGIVENLFGFYVSTAFKSVVPFAVILLMLAIKPSGLLARHYVKKV
ncbi:MAG: branched-chain amino acid ABC transporter permease [Burkholderiales bacterium]|jgi:branched-chain amino acid transport system permease protein|nr:High-affinity branched-chain amino acid transport system permease protein LivH [Rhodocyclaceae bacterium]MCZ2418726.1 branched-chain amino acid ABC transporter permease [Burkholderiales bacterium]OQY75225.1 MAG: branched-chain amino acid ABC transporter permease [Rhodocyclaceae bacterium UTPRO2]HNQ58287.1 branched-chain amino acid ABC transporter permease [Candidatus Desulfobacillus denitrificans]MCQ3923004.1 branched-chain amino acid ABC transporter permease [Rhodocyclaceae bacterium]